MKRIFLFMMASLSIVSFCNCSDDEKSSTPTAITSVSVKVDGVQKTFSKVEIIKKTVTENGVPRVDIHVKAMNPNNETEYFEFGIGQGDHGDNQLWAFIYVNNGTLYLGDSPEEYQAGLANTVTISTEKRIVGSFAGRVKAEGEDGVDRELSDGTFDISF